MLDTTRILKNIKNKYPEFNAISQIEMDIIGMIVEGETSYLSDSDWNDILYESEESELIQSVLCHEDYYDSRYAHSVAKHLSIDLYPEFLKKENVQSKTAEYICERIHPLTLQEIIQNNPKDIAEPYKKIIRGYDFDKSEDMGFEHYNSFDGMNINAEYMVSKYHFNEKLMTAISNNENIREDIRNKAFDNMHDPLVITNYTNYMKMSMYHSAAERIFDYPQKTMEDAEQIENATDILLHMLDNKKMPLSCEYDLLQRLQSMPSIGSNRTLTNALLNNTMDAIILKKAYEYNPTMTRNIVRKNKNCDIFTLEDFINESIKKIKELINRGETSIDILKEKQFICNKLTNQPLSLQSYKQIHKFAKKHDELLDYMIIANPYIRTNSIKELFKTHKYELIKLRELLESEFAKHGFKNNQYLKYLDFAIYHQMKNNKEYFENPTSLSLKTFVDRFGTPIKNITEKEKDIISDVCDKIDPEREVEWIKTLDETTKIVYNIENEFGPNKGLYSYENEDISFDNIMHYTNIPYEDRKQFAEAIISRNDLTLLEKVQYAIEKQIAEQGVCGKSCMDMCRISEFYDKISEKIEEIERVMEDRNMGFDL